MADRIHLVGSLKGKDLVDAYHSFDCFAFASETETQGLVVLEAMAAGLNVVGLKAPGVEDILEDNLNGLLVSRKSENEFAAKLQVLVDKKVDFRNNALATAGEYGKEKCVQKALDIYKSLSKQKPTKRKFDEVSWKDIKKRITTEYNILVKRTKATKYAFYKKKQ